MIKIMFVCTGNVCRSAMAHGYMQYLVNKKQDKNNYLISSCGTHGITGEKATDYAKAAMMKYNVELSNHRAKNINDIDIESYDIIICMTSLQKACVKDLYPKISEKVYTLKEYIDEKIEYTDIDDPWGLSQMVYDTCAKEIVESVDKLYDKISR